VRARIESGGKDGVVVVEVKPEGKARQYSFAQMLEDLKRRLEARSRLG